MTEWSITHIPTIDSTMDWVRARALESASDFTAIRAHTQTAGRGRLGRVWASPIGNLYFSFILRVPQGGVLPLALALALHDTLRSLIPNAVPIVVKWPNDVMVDDRKIAGILVEREGDYAVIGIGVNVAEAPDDKAALSTWSNASVDELLTKLTASTTAWLSHDQEDVVTRWNELAAYKDQSITFKQGKVSSEGVFMGVDALGYARIANKAGDIKSYASGEIMEVRPC